MDSNSKPLGEKNYEQFAERYAKIALNKSENAHYDRPATLSLLPQNLNGYTILDAGCGPGFYAEDMLNMGTDFIYAIDVTPAMVKLTTDRLTQSYAAKFDAQVANLEEPLSFLDDESVDLVVCPLVLDYIADWRVPFAEFNRVLKPNGLFVASVTHPAIEFDNSLRTNYHDIELIEMTWNGFGEPKPVMQYYRRPLAEIINPLIETGFKLDKLLEAKPTEAFKDVNPEGYAYYSLNPGFLWWRAKKL